MSIRRVLVPLGAALVLLAACDSGKKDEAAKKAEAKAGATAKAAEAKAKAEIAEAEAKLDAMKAKSEAVAAKAEPAEEDYGGEFCATIIPCFEKMKFAGHFMADVSVDIEPDGSVSAVSFTGDAPKPVQTCITDTIKGITLASYNGKPGRTRCTKSGQLVGGTKMIMSDSTYEVREAGAGAEGKAAEGKAAEGKAAEDKAVEGKAAEDKAK